jgi:hypothetical protein
MATKTQSPHSRRDAVLRNRDVKRLRVGARIALQYELRRYPPDYRAFALPSDSAQALATAEFG